MRLDGPPRVRLLCGSKSVCVKARAYMAEYRTAKLVAATCFFATWHLAAANEYVDAKKCAACHPQIAASYRQTAMSRSFYRPSTAANTIQDFVHALSDTRYSMVERDGVYSQRRWQFGFGGKETNLEEAKINYVFGAR